MSALHRRLLIAGLAITATPLCYGATDPSDVAALKDLQSCVKAAGSKPYLMGWNDDNPCSMPIPWTGLLCTGDRVTAVLMSQLGPNSLQGCDIGSLGSLSGLSKVAIVDFTATAVEGYLPAAWASGFGALKSLTMMQNKFSGPLPPSWGQGFPALETLNLASNSLNGTLPSSWAAGFPALLNLVVNNNRLQGGLPESTSGWGNLELLMLHDNVLTGTLPATWQTPKLKILELWNNQLAGCLPEGLAQQLPELQALKIWSNALKGPLPGAWDNWNSLTSLSFLPGNALCGSVSAKLAATPDGKGRRIQPEPANQSTGGGYDLPACPTDLTCKAPLVAPAPAPSQGGAAGVAAPDTAPAASEAPSSGPRFTPAAQTLVSAGRRRLRYAHAH